MSLHFSCNSMSIYNSAGDWTYAIHMNICYNVTDRMKPTHETSCNLI